MTEWYTQDWGWAKICDRTDELMKFIDPDYTIRQIKEKFGKLRYYYDSKFPYDSTEGQILAIIASNAEEMSRYTCEDCGIDRTYKKVGDEWLPTRIETKATRYWIKTYCADCRTKDEERYANHTQEHDLMGVDDVG